MASFICIKINVLDSAMCEVFNIWLSGLTVMLEHGVKKGGGVEQSQKALQLFGRLAAPAPHSSTHFSYSTALSSHCTFMQVGCCYLLINCACLINEVLTGWLDIHWRRMSAAFTSFCRSRS